MKRILYSFLLVAFTSTPSTIAETSYGKEHGLLGPVTFGPKLTIGVPLPLKLGVEAKYLNIVGVSFDYGFFPTIPYENIKFGTQGWSVAARYFVFGQAFFVGAAFGNQQVNFSRLGFISNGLETIQVTGTATYAQTFIAPHIGWRWTWESGMYFGMELGAQIPLSYTREVSSDNADLDNHPDVQALKDEVYGRIDEYGNIPFPLFSLIQFGWYF